MKKILLLSSVMLLTACATTTKKPATPLTPEQRQANIAEIEARNFAIIYNDTVPTSTGNVKVIGRNKVEFANDTTEPNLMIIKKSDTAKVTSLKIVSSILLGGENSFKKNDLKGNLLNPMLANPTLEYARPLITNWVSRNATKYGLPNKPLTTVTYEPNRFYLVYEKLGSGANYQLFNGLTLRIQNTWEPEKTYVYPCEKTSNARPLTDWQANNYAVVKATVQQNIASCLADLDKAQIPILNKLRN